MSANLTIRWEKLTDLLADGLEDLAVAHWEEAETDRCCPLDLDWDRALAFERQGTLKVAALRRNGDLIGYAEVTLLVGGLFYRTTRHAYVQAIYVEPLFRGFAVLALVGWLEAEIGRAGKTKTYVAAKTQRQCDLWEKLGYEFSEVMLSKTVGGEHVERVRTPALHSERHTAGIFRPGG
jgi:hypothetical protein